MKKTILLSSILAVGAAFAVTVDSTEIGVMGVAMPKQAALIAVPFLGYDTVDIKVADMVNTAELANGSKLYVPNDSGTYDIWTLASGQWSKTSSNIVIGDNTASNAGTPAANEVTTKRGGSFWLEPANGTSAENCYLLGKPTTEQGESVLVVDKWNLIGNTSDAAVPLAVGAEGDKVCIPNANGVLDTYTVRSGKWLKGRKTSDTVSIAPGLGVWYLAKSARTIKW